MILPSKHIRFASSLLGLGAILLELLQNEYLTVDELWDLYSRVDNTQDKFPAHHSFDNLILTLNLLHLIGAIDINHQGEVYNATYRIRG